MTTYHSDLLAAPVPRYTSYSAAADFHDRIGPHDTAAAFDTYRPASQAVLSRAV